MGPMISKMLGRIFGQQEVKMLMLGLDNAGKTTILYQLKLGELVNTVPTIGFNVDTVEFRNVKLTIWDVGGQTRIRPLWRYYFSGTQGLIYVVDTNDRERLAESREELQHMLTEEELRKTTVLVLANKQDLPNALPVADVTKELGLENVRNRKWFVQACCATNGVGIFEGLDWLVDNLAK